MLRLRLFTPYASQPRSSNHARQLLVRMHLAQNVQLQLVRESRKPCQLAIGKRSGNQQNRVRAMRPRLNNLILVHNKIFA